MNKNGYFQSDKDGNVTKAPPKKQPPPFSSVSWNDLTDKPFGESATGGDTLTWDGNTEGLTSVMDMLYKVSDAVPSMDDFVNGLTVCVNGTNTELPPDSPGGIHSLSGMLVTGDWSVAVVPQELVGVDMDGMMFTEAGTYFLNAPGTIVCTSLTIPGYTGFPSVKTLDPKYLPSGGGGEFKVNLSWSEDEEGYIPDKTFDEIFNALKSGASVVAETSWDEDSYIDRNPWVLRYWCSDTIEFYRVNFSPSSMLVSMVYIGRDESRTQQIDYAMTEGGGEA